MQALPLPSALNESIYFDYTPPPTFAGHINRHPFKVIITSSNDNPHTVSLSTKYSKSYQPQGQMSKWSFLRPESRFLDLSGNEITDIITTDTPLYVDNDKNFNTVSGNFIGVSGYAEFYFVDDIYNYDFAFNDEKYTTIVALLQTSAINYFTPQSQHIQSSRYTNSKAIAYQPHIFHYRDPDYIKISENGIRDFINPRWVKADQHVVFSFNWNKQYSELYYDGNEVTPINFDSNFNKSLPSNTNINTIDVKAQLVNYDILSIYNEFDKITNSLNNFQRIISNLNDVPATNPSGLISDSTYQNAANSILNYKSQLQQQIVEYAKYNYPTTLSDNALSAKCYRDVGYIIDAITADLINNTNHRSIEVGNMYFNGTLMGVVNTNSPVPTLPQNQIQATVDAIKALLYYINGQNTVIVKPSDKINDLLDNFNKIILSQDNTPATTPAGNITDSSYLNASKNILKYKSQLQKQVIDYANYYYPDAMGNNPTLSAYCYRDAGYIIDAIAADIANNTNHRSIEVGNMYFKGITKNVIYGNGNNTPVIPPEQIIATVDSIKSMAYYINGNIPNALPSFTTTGILSSTELGSSRQADVTARLANVVYPLQNNGSLNDYNPSGSPTEQDIDTANILINNKEALKTQVSDYVRRKGYLNVTPPNPQLAVLCNRDIGLMIDALIHDLSTGINARSIEYALAYWNGSTSRLPNSLVPNHKEKTIDTINTLKSYILALSKQFTKNIPSQPTPFTTTGILSSINLGSARKSDVIDRINNIVYPIQNNGALQRYSPQGSPVSRDIQLAQTLLQNKESIQYRVSNYVSGQGYLKDPTLISKCNRDVGLMIDAVAYELQTGVVARSIQYALAYWEGSNSRLPENIIPNQVAKTIDTINVLKNLLLELYRYESNRSIIKAYFSNDKIQLNYKNQDQYLSPGYCKTLFNVGNGSTAGVAMTATSEFLSPNTKGNMYSPKMWLSNPNAGMVGLVEYNFPQNFDLDPKLLQKAQIYNFDVPIVYEPNLLNDRFATTGFHGINSVAVLPAPNYEAWATDGELNYLYKFGTRGQILCAIDLVSLVGNYFGLLVYDQVSPTSVVLDSQQNLWITLYDSNFVLSLDKDGNIRGGLNLLQQIEYVTPPSIDTDWYGKNQPYPDVEETQNYVEPTFLDTDSLDNIWVTYSNYASGYLLKFDYNNNILQTISYPVCSCPQDLIIDNQDNVWVALSNDIWRSVGTIEKRNTDGQLLSSFGPIMGVNELTLDPEQNLWFTYSYSRIGYIDNITGTVSTFNVLDNSENSHYVQKPYVSSPTINTDETALEGITCDLKGYLYVVNSVENQIYIYNTKTKTFVDKFYVNPQGFTFWTKTEAGPTEIEYNQWDKSLQAHGDWMGTKWLNKYYKKPDTYQISISGNSCKLDFIAITSRNFNPNYSLLANTFYKYIETNYYQKIIVTPRTTLEPISINDVIDVFKINENYDLGAQIKSYALTPTLQESSYLFDKFLPSIYGFYPYNHQDFGVFSYEKIANFVMNNSDIDTCEIDKLYSMSSATDTNTDDFLLNYPLEIKRLMDVLSISQTRLWGAVEKNQNNFKEPSSDGQFNRGQLLTSNYTVSAGVPVILKTKSLDKYELIQTGPIYGLTQYPLTFLVNLIGINQAVGGAWEGYYEFYEFLPSVGSYYSDNIIDWNNPQTTISQNITSVFDWIGDEQAIDKIFSYHLYTGLGIF